MLQYELLIPSRDISEHVSITETWTTPLEQSRLTPSLWLLSHLIMLRGWHRSKAFVHTEIWLCGTSVGGWGWWLTPIYPRPPAPQALYSSQRLISPSSSFHSSVNDITHLSPKPQSRQWNSWGCSWSTDPAKHKSRTPSHWNSGRRRANPRVVLCPMFSYPERFHSYKL